MQTRDARGTYNRTAFGAVKAPRARRLVGVLASPEDLRRARRLRKPPDFLELRLDCLAREMTPAEITRALRPLAAPLILTARSRREGGMGGATSIKEYPEWRDFYPLAAFIDLELRSLRPRDRRRAEAQRTGLGLILSVHEFHHSFCRSELAVLADLALKHGAAILKVVSRVKTEADIETLADFITAAPLPVSAAGVGRLAATSRKLLLRAGSALNYGYFSKPVVAGQLSVAELRRHLRQLN